jgi:hypothetical protein
MDKFRVVVAGGRHFNQFELLTSQLDAVLGAKRLTHEIVIVSGKARGADQLGERYAKLRGYAVQEHHADWDGQGKSAGYRRNEEMAKNSDASVVFWDGKSVGSKHMVDLTKTYGNPIKVVSY